MHQELKVGGYGNGNIINCYNSGKITAAFYAAGIADGATNITNCNNYGDIYSYGRDARIAGIGISTGTIKNCKNAGNLTADANTETLDNSFIGGIGIDSNIQYCTNSGTITNNRKTYTYIGGISSTRSSSYGVLYSYNTGDIYNNAGYYSVYIGGITSQTSAVYCYNTGNITNSINSENSVYAYIGGVSASGTCANSYNTGNITNNVNNGSSYSTYYIGGITGGSSSVSNSYNIGSIYNNATITSGTCNVGPLSTSTATAYSNGSYYLRDISNSYYLDDIDIITNINNYNISNNNDKKKTKEEMQTEQFANTLGGSANKWLYIPNQYPTLDISAITDSDKATELTVKNTIKTFDITTEIGLNDDQERTGGTITGTYDNKHLEANNIKYVETVQYGEPNTQNININPTEGYMIKSVTINGENIDINTNSDDSFTLNAGYFENAKSDYHIVATFMEKEKALIINKKDEEENALQGAKFKIEGEFDEPGEIKDLTPGNPNYYFIENDDKTLSVNNMANSGTQAHSYYTVDLTDREEDSYVVVISRTSNGTNYGIVTENTDVPNTNDMSSFQWKDYGKNGISRYIYVSQALQGGKVYYLHLKYSSPGNTSSTQEIESIKLLTKVDNISDELTPAVEGGKYFEKQGNIYVPNNLDVTGEKAISYYEIDLTNKVGDYYINVNVTKNMYNGSLSGIIKDEIDQNPQSLSGNTYLYNGENKEWVFDKISGGRKYYLYFIYNNTKVDENSIVSINKINILKSINTHELETDSNGKIIERLQAGEYKIKEIEAPEGYEKSDEIKTATTSTGNIQEITFTNHKQKQAVIHYYLKSTKDAAIPIKLHEDVNIYGKAGDEYDSSKYIETEIQGYTLELDDKNQYVIPENAVGTFASEGIEPIEINLYYERKNDVKLNLTVIKKWIVSDEELDNYMAKVRLFKVVNGQEVEVFDEYGNPRELTIRGNRNEGKATFIGLDKYENNEKIKYVVKEISIEKCVGINNETQEEMWKQIPMNQFDVVYE